MVDAVDTNIAMDHAILMSNIATFKEEVYKMLILKLSNFKPSNL